MPRGIYNRTKENIGYFKKGHTVSYSLRKKLSKIHKGNKYSVGRKVSINTLEKMSLSHKGKKWTEEQKFKLRLIRKKGSESPNWIKDRSKIKIGDRSLHDPLQKQWRKNVKNRDNWACRIADINCEGRLEAHHILSWADYPELRYEVNNGITLCHFHHPRIKKDVEELSPYFQKLVAELK